MPNVALNYTIIQLFVKEFRKFVKKNPLLLSLYFYLLSFLPLCFLWFQYKLILISKLPSYTDQLAPNPAFKTSSFSAILISQLNESL